MTKLESLWVRILQSDPVSIFGNDVGMLLDRNWGDRIPQPGYVGRLYSEGGIVFVSMNPGGMRGDGLGETDRIQLGALHELRAARIHEVRDKFLATMRVLETIMPTWTIFRNFVEPILNSAHIELPSVAYVNLLKWRTKKDARMKRLYDASWNAHTREQLLLLDPQLVISIGMSADNALRRLYTGKATVLAIPRVIGNNIGLRGREAIERICQELRVRRD